MCHLRQKWGWFSLRGILMDGAFKSKPSQLEFYTALPRMFTLSVSSPVDARIWIYLAHWQKSSDLLRIQAIPLFRLSGLAGIFVKSLLTKGPNLRYTSMTGEDEWECLLPPLEHMHHSSRTILPVV